MSNFFSFLMSTLNINVQIAHMLLGIFIKKKVSTLLKKVLGIAILKNSSGF